MDLQDGKKLVALARKSVESYFSKQAVETEEFRDKSGVFVTIHTIDGDLRGCIGYILPFKPLGQAVIEAARAAAFSDPRFSPLVKSELDEIIFEVSILTEPKLIKVSSPKDYPKKIKIGKDGLIIECNTFEGILLPQVPVEENWDEVTYLNQLCLKAGLLEENWKQKNCKIYKFQAEIFKEKEPKGEICLEQ
jgi:hypothetical protein